MNDWGNWKRQQDASLFAKYRRWWRDFSFSMTMLHIIVAGLLVFLFTLKSYQDGDIGWFWPAIGLAVATLACFALFIPLADDDVR